MLNVSTIMGRLTRDPELRRTDSGIAVTSFSVAVDRDRAPEGQEKETDFIDCVAWRSTAEFVSKYFSKGSMIVVSGRLQIRRWTDKEGQKRRSAEIVADIVYFGEGKKDKAQEQPQYGGYQGAQPPQYGGYNTPVYQTPQQAAPPQYAQGGFGGYQQPAFQAPAYQPPQGQFVRIDGPDPQLPF